MPGRRGGRMSGGEQQMLAIARTLAGNPKAILLDEPSEGLAPLVVNAVIKAIEELKRAGMTILLAEQSLRFAERIADRVYKVEKGRLT
jgi:branched-chain amino acid transport system ATP-binding protein